MCPATTLHVYSRPVASALRGSCAPDARARAGGCGRPVPVYTTVVVREIRFRIDRNPFNSPHLHHITPRDSQDDQKNAQHHLHRRSRQRITHIALHTQHHTVALDICAAARCAGYNDHCAARKSRVHHQYHNSRTPCCAAADRTRRRHAPLMSLLVATPLFAPPPLVATRAGGARSLRRPTSPYHLVARERNHHAFTCDAIDRHSSPALAPDGEASDGRSERISRAVLSAACERHRALLHSPLPST